MSWLLDTCVLSEPVQRNPSARVLAWLDQQEDEMLHVSVLALGEIRQGAARLPPGPRRRRLEQWLDRDLRTRFSGRILAVDGPVADRWGRLQAETEAKGRPMPSIDGLIAATALAHGLRVVTRNVDDFAASAVEIFNPWSAEYPAT
ncbi:MAG TPA: type II toxin-antitoxin system VapC family toxin [Opitutaceae bacterium]|jgi:predicted nucleic acid-binding protein|nr:type II toxin-antitoxin system VapC family toxin [Opitutaceae bacterium]